MLRRRKIPTECIFICLFNKGSLFFRKSAVGEDGINIGQGKRHRLFFFFILCRNIDQTIQISLNIKEHSVAFFIIFTDHIFYHILEGNLLFGCGKFCTTAKSGFHKFCMRRFRVSSVKHDGMNVCAPVGKSRKYKPSIRCPDNPVTDTRPDTVFILAVAKSRFGEIHRTDRAQQIFVYFFRFI